MVPHPFFRMGAGDVDREIHGHIRWPKDGAWLL